MNVLFLFESNLTDKFHTQTTSPNELRIIASLPQVKNVYAIGRKGAPFYELAHKKTKQDTITKKIRISRMWGTSNSWSYWLSTIWLFIYGYKLLSQHKIDCIHCESPHISAPAAILLGYLFHIPILVEVRVTYPSLIKFRYQGIIQKFFLAYYQTIATWTLRQASVAVGNSRSGAKLLKAYLPKRIEWYSPGIQAPQVPTSHPKSSILHIGFLGRLYPEKGAKYLLQATKLLVARLPSKSFQVLIAGNGPERASLETYASYYSLPVTFLGTQERWQFLNQIDIFVNTTLVSPTLEMSNAEAACMGIPVISFADQHGPDTLIHQQTGIKVPDHDVSKLAKAIELLITNKSLRAKYGKNGYAFAREQFTSHAQTKRLNQIYSRLGLI